MIESHHLISSLISPATISRSRHWTRMQPSFEHLKLSYLELFSKNWEYFRVRWHLQLCTSTTDCTSPIPVRGVEAAFQKLYAMSQVYGSTKNLWNASTTDRASFCENRNPHNCCSKLPRLFRKLLVTTTVPWH